MRYQTLDELMGWHEIDDNDSVVGAGGATNQRWWRPNPKTRVASLYDRLRFIQQNFLAFQRDLAGKMLEKGQDALYFEVLGTGRLQSLEQDIAAAAKQALSDAQRIGPR